MSSHPPFSSQSFIYRGNFIVDIIVYFRLPRFTDEYIHENKRNKWSTASLRNVHKHIINYRPEPVVIVSRICSSWHASSSYQLQTSTPIRSIRYAVQSHSICRLCMQQHLADRTLHRYSRDIAISSSLYKDRTHNTSKLPDVSASARVCSGKHGCWEAEETLIRPWGAFNALGRGNPFEKAPTHIKRKNARVVALALNNLWVVVTKGNITRQRVNTIK